MVWEVAQDFGMGMFFLLYAGGIWADCVVCVERPIRSFEVLFDIQSSWNKDKSTNMFVLKLTPLSSLLSRSVRSFSALYTPVLIAL